MSTRRRRRHTPQQKADLLWAHLGDKKPVSDVCNEADIQPSLFYSWQRDLLAGTPEVFSRRTTPGREKELEDEVSRLKARLARKDLVIAEVTEEYVQLKKELGEA